MVKVTKCSNSEFENASAYSVKKSRVWEEYNAVYMYAQLNTDESKDCYQKYLDLTASYLTWDSVKASKKKKENIEAKRKIANEKIN